MADLIKRTDTLNQGREKLNTAITDAETAKIVSEQADDKATQALAKSESTQTQLDTIVIEGDSSVEAAQARVSTEGTPYTTLKERLDTEYSEVTSLLAQNEIQLERKINKGDSISVSQIDKNTGKFDQTYMTEEFLQQIAGNTPVNAVPADGSLTKEKYAEKSIVTKHLSEITNRETVTYQRLYEDSLLKNINHLTIASDGTLNLALAGSEASVSYVNNDLPIPYKQKTIRWNYGTALTHLNKNAIQKEDGTPIQTGFWIRKSDITDELKFSAQLDFFGSTTVNCIYSAFFVKDLKPGDSISELKNGVTMIVECLYEIGDWRYILFRTDVWLSTANYGSARFYLKKEAGTISGKLDLAGLTISRGSQPLLPHIPYENQPLKTVDEKIADVKSELRWSGKNMVIFGDSIQWQDGKPYASNGLIARGMGTIIKEKLGLNVYDNLGVSGRPMANGTANGDGTNTTIRNYDSFSNKDLVIIAAGTNDFKLNVPLGSLGEIGDTTFDNTTFFGAYREAIEHILTQKPTIRITLFTPLQRDNGGYNVNTVNTSGHKLIDYVNAIQEIGEMYGLPVCDMYRNSGFTKKTLTTFTLDGLHPNDVGYSRMGGYASQFIDSIAK